MNTNDIDEIIRQHEAELRKEYQEIYDRILNGDARSQDYIHIMDYAEMINEKISDNQKEDYLRKAYSAAQSELLSSDDDERAAAYLTLAQYYDKLKDYQNALKNYDSAVKIDPHNIVLRARFRVLSMHDRAGAKKDFELAKSSGLSDYELKLFDILVDNAGARREKTQLFIFNFCLVLFVIVVIIYCYLKFFV